MIGQLAHDVVEHAARCLTAAGYVAPDRRYVSHAAPAGDLCEELVAWVDPVANPAVSPGVVTHQAVVHVDLTRCVPTASAGDPVPNADPLTVSAVDLADQAWVIWTCLVASIDTGDGPFAPCSQTVPIDLIPLGPDGVFGTWRATFRVTITPTAV